MDFAEKVFVFSISVPEDSSFEVWVKTIVQKRK